MAAVQPAQFTALGHATDEVMAALSELGPVFLGPFGVRAVSKRAHRVEANGAR
jgi:hypothetical protein